MKGLLGIIPAAILYGCAATVVAQVGAVTVLSSQGVLTREKVYQCMAVFYGVNLQDIEKKATAENQPPPHDNPAYDQIIAKRVTASRDLDLREVAVKNALVDVRALSARLKTERERYDQLKQQFDLRLAQLEQQFTDAALQEVQQTLEVMSPKQSKEQILLMLDKAVSDKPRVERDVVTILKQMSLDKRKKILAEFKSEEEQQTLHDILKQIREGVPDTALVRETRAQLAQYKSNNSTPVTPR